MVNVIRGDTAFKIVLFAYSFLPNKGGGEQYNFTLATGLSQMGQDIFVVTPQKLKGRDSYPFPVIRTRTGLIGSVFDLNRVLRKIKPDLLHISGPTPIDFLLFYIAKIHRVKVVLTYHADFPSTLGRMLNKLIFLFRKECSILLVQTERDKQKLISRGIFEDQIIKFPFNGVNGNIFKLKNYGNRDIDILFIGRMDKEHSYKGYWALLEIIKEIKKMGGERYPITIVGGSVDFPSFIEKSIGDNLTLKFLTDLDEEKLVYILNRTKTIILPSTSNSEGFGRVVLEAIFCGVVPVVSKYAGSSEIIDEYNAGIVIDPFNFKSSAEAMIDLLNNAQKLYEFRKNGIKMLAKGYFTIDWTINKTLEIYRKIVKQEKSRKHLL